MVESKQRIVQQIWEPVVWHGLSDSCWNRKIHVALEVWIEWCKSND